MESAKEKLNNETVEYDKFGRMKYHPEYHENHGKPFKLDELIYLCKYWETDGAQSLSLGLARTEKALYQKVSDLKKNNQFEYYKNLELT